jgi:hypothetical protein
MRSHWSLLMFLTIGVLLVSAVGQPNKPIPGVSPPQGPFPYTKEVIPGKLKVRIFLHDLRDQNETISCWSYVTEGLWALKQKELIFTLRRDPGQKPEDHPKDIFDLVEGIYRCCRGRKAGRCGQCKSVR